jgi:hypothetical protein
VAVKKRDVLPAMMSITARKTFPPNFTPFRGAGGYLLHQSRQLSRLELQPKPEMFQKIQ